VSDTDVAVRCSAWAREVALSPIATIGTYAGYLLVETPLPWPHDVGQIPRLAGVTGLASSAGLRLQALVPSSPDELRIVLHWSPGAASGFSRYRRFETAAGDDLEGSVRDLIASVGRGSRELESPGTDLLVCTHGRRDICCGSQGTGLALQLATAGVGHLRTSHTGGHRFAPTFLVLPEGMAWAYADLALVESVLHRSVPFADVADRYRGCAGLSDRRIQALEREVLSVVGWEVLDASRRGMVDGATARLEVTYGDGRVQVWEAEVPDGRTLPVPDCMHPLSEAKKTETELVVSRLRSVS
jgi:hypothetical protein